MSTDHWNRQDSKTCPTPPSGAPVFQVEPRNVMVSSGVDVELPCRAAGEPVPTIEWLRAGRPLQAGRRLRALPDGSLWLERVEAGDAGVYECVAHNLLGSVTAKALLAVRGKGRPCLGLQTESSGCVLLSRAWTTALQASWFFTKLKRSMRQKGNRCIPSCLRKLNLRRAKPYHTHLNQRSRPSWSSDIGPHPPSGHPMTSRNGQDQIRLPMMPLRTLL